MADPELYGKNWYVGMEVAYIDPPDHLTKSDESPPFILNRIYKIADIIFHNAGEIIWSNEGFRRMAEDSIYITVEEVPWAVCHALCFKPIEKRQTDISIFERFLTPTPTKIKKVEHV